MIVRLVSAALSILSFGFQSGTVESRASETEVHTIPFEFTIKNGWVFDGKIELPPTEECNGFAVMLLGGALGGPIDWKIPGILTIDGKPTYDADVITRALLGEGFVVFRWNAIRRGDPEYAKDPLLLEGASLPVSIEQAENAFEVFIKRQLIPVKRTFLVGHSLGGYRAGLLLDKYPEIAGVVMLAGASVVRANKGSAVTLLGVFRNLVPAEDKAAIPQHERAVEYFGLNEAKWLQDKSTFKNPSGRSWGCDVIATHQTPTLYLVGALDDRWLLECYMLTHLMRTAKHPDYAWKVFENLGHNLGAEEPGDVVHQALGVIAHARVGPISADVVDAVVTWLTQRANRTRASDQP